MPTVLKERVAEIRKELDAKREAAKQAWATLEAEKAKYVGVDLANDEEAFKSLDEAGKAYDSLADEVSGIKAKHDRLVLLDGNGQKVSDSLDQPKGKRRSFKSLGQAFLDSEIYKTQIRQAIGGSGNWKVDPIDVSDWLPSLGMKATLTEDAASGGDLVVPDYRPGIVPILFRRLTVAELFLQGTTQSNLINYMKETTATNAAAATAEGAAKPESTLIFDLVSDAVRKISTFLPVSDEMLEDEEQIRSYIDGRLEMFLMLTEEDQLLNGSGTAPNIQGVLNRTGLQTAQALGVDTRADAIHKAITKIRANAFLEPDGLVIHPNDWEQATLEKDSNGQYLGGGPFVGPYGVGGVQSESAGRTYWGLRPVVTPAIAEGTALVGAFTAGGQVFRRKGITIEASNSHSDFFQKDLTALRAYERLALAVYRPGAFGTVTGL